MESINPLEDVDDSEDLMLTHSDSGSIDLTESGSDKLKWDHSATKLLLNTYSETIKEIGKSYHLRTKSQCWVYIAEELNKYGYSVTPLQVRNRFVTLVRAYKKRQNDMKNFGSSKSKSIYDEEIRNMLKTHRFNNLTDTENELIYIKDDNGDLSLLVEDVEQSMTDTSSFQPNSNKFWNLGNTQLLLDLYDKTVNDTGLMNSFKTKQEMWQSITDQINAHGYDFGVKQTQNRLGTLQRAYKKFVQRKKNGTRSFFQFEKELNKILKHKRSIMANFDSVIDDTSSFDAHNEDLNFIEMNIAGIDNVTIPTEIPTIPAAWDQSKNDSEFREFSYIDSRDAVVREVILLRKQEFEFNNVMLKLEREKITLMRKNNELLKSMIEKIDAKRH